MSSLVAFYIKRWLGIEHNKEDAEAAEQRYEARREWAEMTSERTTQGPRVGQESR